MTAVLLKKPTKTRKGPICGTDTVAHCEQSNSQFQLYPYAKQAVHASTTSRRVLVEGGGKGSDIVERLKAAKEIACERERGI